jgi:hypothetical protein
MAAASSPGGRIAHVSFAFSFCICRFAFRPNLGFAAAGDRNAIRGMQNKNAKCGGGG